MDYVYQNQPQGSNAFGRLVDKISPEQCWLARYSPAQNPFTNAD
ncbi:class I SAM-dependent methyltransferase family protein [Escherichia coli]